jgi:hypothetical protein
MVEKNATDTLPRLLLAARIVKQSDLDEAQKSAKRLDVALSRALVMLKFASEGSLKAPLQAEELVRKGKLSFEIAVKALNMTRQNGIELDDAINVIGAVVTKTQNMPTLTNNLTELLMAAEMLTGEQLGEAIQKSRDAQMSVGRTLVVNRHITRWALAEALTAQLLVRDSKITKDQAINALRAAGRRRTGVAQILFELGQYNESSGESLKLAELILMAGFLSEGDYLEAVEIEATEEKPFGQVLVEQHLVESSFLESACQILDMVGSVLKPFQAAEALRQIRAKNIGVYQAIAELQPPPQVAQRKMRLGDLLTESGILQREAVEAVAQNQEESPIRIGKKLLAAGLLSEPFLYTSLRCQSLAKEGLLSADNAVLVLTTCRRDNVNIDEALNKHGWHIPARMHWSWT